MATQPALRRRIDPASAVARGPAPRTETTVRGEGHVTTVMKDKLGPYYNTRKDVLVNEATFTEENPPAKVRLGVGLTIDMGNYEFLRIDCQVEIPCHNNLEDMDAAYRMASDFAAEKLSEEQVTWLSVPKHEKGKS